MLMQLLQHPEQPWMTFHLLSPSLWNCVSLCILIKTPLTEVACAHLHALPPWEKIKWTQKTWCWNHICTHESHSHQEHSFGTHRTVGKYRPWRNKAASTMPQFCQSSQMPPVCQKLPGQNWSQFGEIVASNLKETLTIKDFNSYWA